MRIVAPGRLASRIPASVEASQLLIVTTSARAKIVSHASTGTWATAGDTDTTRVTSGGRAAAHSLSSEAACALVISEAATWTTSPSRNSMLANAARDGSDSTPAVTTERIDPSSTISWMTTPMSPTSSGVSTSTPASTSC